MYGILMIEWRRRGKTPKTSYERVGVFLFKPDGNSSSATPEMLGEQSWKFESTLVGDKLDPVLQAYDQRHDLLLQINRSIHGEAQILNYLCCNYAAKSASLIERKIAPEWEHGEDVTYLIEF
jgi:hypothetical protein